MKNFLTSKPIISALHFPRFVGGPGKLSISAVEDYVLKNVEVFYKGGIRSIILQDETYTEKRVQAEVLTVMAAVSRLAVLEFPDINFGIIIESHDPQAALAVAYASGASFVRIKVFVGAMLKSTGIQQACGGEAIAYRDLLGRNDISILADVHDRTGLPMAAIPIEMAAHWADSVGADALILTGQSVSESIEMIQNVKDSGNKKPILVGGGVTSENVNRFLQVADGIIVSTILKRDSVSKKDPVIWDLDKIKKFMDVVNHK